MSIRTNIKMPSSWRLSVPMLALALLMSVGSLPALAQSNPAPAQGDKVELVGLTTRQPSADSPPQDVQFEATINYRLTSVSSGTVLLFLFENSSDQSTQDSSNAIPVQQGSGQMVLDINYTLRPEVKTLTLVAGLFKGEKKLLAWVSTNAIDMGPWPGRVAFEKAMAARLDNDFTTADQLLTQAIQEAPTTGNFYYWRGDTRIRMNSYADAAADFDQAIQLMPDDRPSRVGRGIAHLWLGDVQAALDDLNFAIDKGTSPDRISAWAYRARGLARTSLGDSTEAISDYQAYLSLTPNASDRAQVEGWIADLSS
ncbi:MAG: tetratricopeptide repeat protein [Chloroflexi bacterium]|nr:tetratricopeptide repeat protein [Chloroflexota bacterium]